MRRQSRPTIRDVARAAGVGVGTVSRVLSGGANVAAPTLRAVQAAIEGLGYRPSPSARGLARGRSHTLEVLVPLFTRYFYVEVMRGVVGALAGTAYALVLKPLERPADRDRAFAEAPAGHADGVLLASVPPTDAVVAALAAARVPAALVDATHPALPSVTVAYATGARLMAEHVVRLGHRRLALIDRPDNPFRRGESARERAVRAVCAEAGVPAPRVVTVPWGPAAGAAALDRLLSGRDPPTVVMTGSDMQAIGVLDQARERGLRVPDDLAVCGYHDIEIARHLGLTTVRVPMRELGERGAALLLGAVRGEAGPPEHVALPVELVVRATCGAPRAG